MLENNLQDELRQLSESRSRITEEAYNTDDMTAYRWHEMTRRIQQIRLMLHKMGIDVND